MPNPVGIKWLLEQLFSFINNIYLASKKSRNLFVKIMFVPFVAWQSNGHTK